MILQTKFHVITQRETGRDSVSTYTTHFRNDPARVEYKRIRELTQQCGFIVTLSCYYDDDDNYCIRTKQLPHAVVAPRTILVAESSRRNCAQYYSPIQKVNNSFFRNENNVL
jgi:hypothetical protein